MPMVKHRENTKYQKNVCINRKQTKQKMVITKSVIHTQTQNALFFTTGVSIWCARAIRKCVCVFDHALIDMYHLVDGMATTLRVEEYRVNREIVGCWRRLCIETRDVNCEWEYECECD